MRSRPRRLLSLLLRLAVSGALLAYLLTRFDAAAALATFGEARLLPLLPAVLFFLLVVVICSLRWRLLSGTALPRRFFFDLTFVGYFFNNFLPTNFGGDAVRILGLSRATGGAWREALLSVFWDRYTGLAGLLILGGGAALLRFELLSASSARLLYPAALGGFLLTAFFLALAARPASPPGRLMARYFPLRLAPPPSRTTAAALVLSLAAQTAGIVTVWCLALSLGVPLSLTDAFLYLPLANLAAMLPLSLSGLGVREGAMVYLLGLSGVPAPQALALSLGWFLFVAAMSLWGGLLFLRKGGGVSPLPS